MLECRISPCMAGGILESKATHPMRGIWLLMARCELDSVQSFAEPEALNSSYQP